jgi:peptide/nickel transport system permease protein
MNLRYVLVRLSHSALSVLGVLVLVFVVTHLLGDPVRIVLPNGSPPELIAATRKRLGLNDPLLVQFGNFLWSAAFDSFGQSYWQYRPALQVVLERVPATLYLAAAAIAIILPLGLGMGVLAALRPEALLARVINVLSFMSVSVVGFWLALMLILVFSVNLRILPTSGYGGLDHVLLPALTLALLQFGALAQVTRACLAEELSMPYVSAARARGISEARVVVGHAVRNASIPIVTYCGLILLGLLGGSIIVETVFGGPGVGFLLIQAIQRRDLPLIYASVFVGAIVVILVNLIVDLLYARLNPRVRLT